jgi:hypothetical protein
MVEDSLHSRFARANVNYGVGRNMSIGAGAEYLSSVQSGPTMPFLNASVRLSSSMMFYGEYTHGVKTRGMLTYRTPLKGQLELNYTRYERAQRAITFNYIDERKISFSIPYQTRGFSGVTRLMQPGDRNQQHELYDSRAIGVRKSPPPKC